MKKLGQQQTFYKSNQKEKTLMLLQNARTEAWPIQLYCRNLEAWCQKRLKIAIKNFHKAKSKSRYCTKNGQVQLVYIF